HHFQARAIPPWERRRLPVLVAGARLLFAAGIGMNVRDIPWSHDAGVSISWRPETGAFPRAAGVPV
ncbi:MAG TPA: TilS substrate C-terminal domain-containing protein, partial [Noviherbaspirillum sp.]|nr:TilS substrate C-terminal domain-containing protein [Noviherbaspirillum sp.]